MSCVRWLFRLETTMVGSDDHLAQCGEDPWFLTNADVRNRLFQDVIRRLGLRLRFDVFVFCHHQVTTGTALLQGASRFSLCHRRSFVGVVTALRL